MDREPNLTPDKRATLHRGFHNPLFNVLTDQFDNMFLEKELDDRFIFEHLYVTTRSTEEIAGHIKLRQPETAIRSSDDLHSQVSATPGLVYLLIGKKGEGKTCLMKYYWYTLTEKQQRDDRLVIYLDLKHKKADRTFLDQIEMSLLREIFEFIKFDSKVPGLVFEHITKPISIREIDTNYHYLNDDTLTQRVLDRPEEAVSYLLRWLSRRGFDVILLVDNVDDFPKSSIKRIIDKCIEIRNSFRAKCVVALRDYWSPASLQIEDENICSCHLARPDIYQIVLRRLSAIDTSNITKIVRIRYGGKPIVLGPEDIIEVFKDISEQFIHEKSLHEQLLLLANYNVREHLRNIYYFFHSPYLFSKPIFTSALVKRILQEDPTFNAGRIRPLRFYDFIECFMGIHSLCYDPESRLFNLFFHDYSYKEGLCYKNTLIFMRILQIVPKDGKSIEVDYIWQQLSAIGYTERPAVQSALQHLLNDGLLESEDGIEVQDIQTLRISTKGSKYYGTLLLEYTYHVFISDAVPMPGDYKVDLLEKFGNEEIPIERGNLQIKNEAVEKFLEFIQLEEEAETKSCPYEHQSVLDRIRGKTLERIKLRTGQAFSRMLTYTSRRTKKIDHVEVIEHKQ